jgi:hypothetical protein
MRSKLIPWGRIRGPSSSEIVACQHHGDVVFASLFQGAINQGFSSVIDCVAAAQNLRNGRVIYHFGKAVAAQQHLIAASEQVF